MYQSHYITSQVTRNRTSNQLYTLFTNKPGKIVLDGYAMLLVGNRYNRTFVIMNFILCAYNTTGHNIVQPTTVSHNQYVEPTAINILIDIFQKYFVFFLHNRIHKRWLQANKQVNKCIVEAHSGSPHHVLQDRVHDSVCGYCLFTVITVGILGGGKTLLLQFN